MVEIDKYLENKGLRDDVRMLLQVHDELVFEIKEKLVEVVAPEIKRMMEGVIDTKKTSGIVMLTECSAGDNWVETKKVL
jgi:DNA polymerase-1